MNKVYNTLFNIAHIEPASLIYGPGCRFVVWLQGCNLHCKGCWNESMWSFEPKILIEREELLNIILSKQVDGVTILGGEPLQQPTNLFWLMKQLKNSAVNIMLYTGYELEEISSNEVYKEICDLADILIPGRYHESERNIFLKWRGSSNQKIISKENVNINSDDGINEVEIVIDEDGSICCLGYPDESLIGIFHEVK